jgi:aminoglycoside/choline kinase family phosphotransferase
MSSNGQVPGSPGDLTPEWLTGVLREGGHLPQGAVSTVAVEPIGADRGFTGVIARLRPTYAGAPGGPESLVVKLPTAEQLVASGYRAARADDPEAARRHFEHCATEVAFYRELANGLADGRAALPRVYHTAADADSLRAVILLEDLGAGTDGDNLAGCTPAQAYAVVEAVAPLHARMWQQPAPAWARPFVTDPAGRQRWYAARVDPFLARYGETLPSWMPGLLRRLQSNYGAVLAELNRAPRTLVHGDLHLDNVAFFDQTVTGSDRPVVVYDWQGVRSGPAMLDLAAVVAGSLSPEHRREVESDLFHRYAQLLRDHGVGDYPLHQARHHYRLALLCQVAGRVNWLANADPEALSPREKELVASAFGDGRLVAALRDHNLT